MLIPLIPTDDFRRQVLEGKVNWEKMVYDATSLLVFPTLHLQLERAGLLPLLPADLVGYMEEFTGLNRERNENIIIQAGEITKLLNKQGIKPVFIKGSAHLLGGLYRDTGERMMKDIDLLVEEQDMTRAAGILMDHGYRMAEPRMHPYAAQRHRHFNALVSDDHPVSVEIHRRVLIMSYSRYFNLGHIREEWLRLPMEGEAYMPSLPHQVLMNMMVVQFNDRARFGSSISLKQAYDLYLLSRETSPMQAIQAFGRFRHVLNRCLATSSYLLGHPPCMEYKANMQTAVSLPLLRWKLRHPGLARLYTKGVRYAVASVPYVRRRLRKVTKGYERLRKVTKGD